MLVSRPRRLGTCPWGHRLTGPGDGGPASSSPIRPRFIPGSPQSCPRIRGDPSTGSARSIHRVVPRCGWKRGGSWTQGDGARTVGGTAALHREPTFASRVTRFSTQSDGSEAHVDHLSARRSAERPLPDGERKSWERHAEGATPDPIGTGSAGSVRPVEGAGTACRGHPIIPGHPREAGRTDLRAGVRVGGAGSVRVRAVTGPYRGRGSATGARGTPGTATSRGRTATRRPDRHPSAGGGAVVEGPQGQCRARSLIRAVSS